MKSNRLAGETGILTKGNRNRRWFTARCIMLVFIAALMALVMPSLLRQTAYASENGADVYPPGTYGDFTMNIHPPGLVVRNNTYFIYGQVNNYPTPLPNPAGGYLPGRSNIDLNAWVDLVQIAYASKDFRLLGARYFSALNIPVASVHLGVDYSYGPLTGHTGGNATGFGDLYIVPFGLLWDQGDFHLLVYENIVAPVGKYDDGAIAKVGKNYWAYDTVAGLTWLDPEGGHEISFCLGYMANTENTATHYRSGDEFHIDYTLAQYLSKTFGVGLTGYYYTQVNNDSGSGYKELNAMYGGKLNGLRSQAAAVGPALLWTPTTICGKPLTLIAKWLCEFHTQNRYKGGQIFLSASMPM